MEVLRPHTCWYNVYNAECVVGLALHDFNAARQCTPNIDSTIRSLCYSIGVEKLANGDLATLIDVTIANTGRGANHLSNVGQLEKVIIHPHMNKKSTYERSGLQSRLAVICKIEGLAIRRPHQVIRCLDDGSFDRVKMSRDGAADDGFEDLYTRVVSNDTDILIYGHSMMNEIDEGFVLVEFRRDNIHAMEGDRAGGVKMR